MKAQVFVVGLLAALILLGSCQTLVTDMFPGDSFVVNEVQETAEVYQGEIYRHRFQDLNFQFSGSVFDRDGNLDSGVNEDFERNVIRNTSTYTKSSICEINPTQVNLEKHFETQELPDQIITYLYDSQYGIFYLSGKWLQYHAVGNLEQNIRLQKLADAMMPKEFNEDDAEMFSVQNNHYIADGDTLFRITVDNNGGKLSLTLHKVAGYKGLSEEQVLVKIIPHDKSTIHVLGTSSITTYSLNEDNISQQEFFPKFFNPTSTFVDITRQENRIYILDKVNGLYAFDSKDGSKYTRFDLQFGNSVKMEAYADTVEVICQYHKNMFVAELMWSGNNLYLNRFYDQISGIRDIDFYDDKALFVGENEIMIINHSVNRNYLLKLQRQHMRSYSAFGLINFQVLVPYTKNSSLVVFGISTYSVVVAKVTQQSAELRCDFSGVGTGQKTFMVEFNTSHCGSGDWKSYHHNSKGSDPYCKIRRAFQLQVKRPYEKKVSNLFSTSLFLVTVICILLVIGAAAKWKVNMNSLLARLRNELRRKQSAGRGSTVAVIARI